VWLRTVANTKRVSEESWAFTTTFSRGQAFSTMAEPSGTEAFGSCTILPLLGSIVFRVRRSLTIGWGLFDLGLAHLRRGNLPRATRVLERCCDLARTWQFVAAIPLVWLEQAGAEMKELA